jgi:putative MFS transporter
MALPESPRWLARSADRTVVNAAIVKLGGAAIDAAGVAVSTTAPHERVPIAALFEQRFRARTIVMIFLWFGTTSVSLGLTAWVPSIYTTVYHIPIAQALRYTATFSVLYVVGMPLIFVAIDRFGRRRPAVVLMAIAAIALSILALARHPPIMLLVPLVISAHLSTGLVTMILWPFTAENYPTSVRAMALGFASSFARASSMVTPLIGGAVIALTGSARPIFALFGGCAVVVLLLWLRGTRETVGIRLDAVQ